MTTLTSNPLILDTICYGVGGAAVLLGVFFVWRALFADRARGRRRCPMCWYDMAGVPGLRCPECGRTAKHESRLARTRRRWRRAIAGTMLVVLGIGGVVTPRVSRQGVLSIVPTTVLVRWATCKDGPMSGMLQARAVLASRSAGPPSWSARCEGEAWRRVFAGEAWEWQSRILVERWLAKRGRTLDDLIQKPPIWRLGTPVALLIRGVELGPPKESSPPSFSTVAPMELIHVQAPTIRDANQSTPGLMRIREPIRIALQNKLVAIGMFETTVEGLSPGQPLLDTVSDENTIRLVRAAIDPRIVVDEVGRDVVISNRGKVEPWTELDCAIGVRVRVMVGARCVGTGEADVTLGYEVWKNYTEVAMAWEPGGLDALLASPEKGVIRVAGSEELAEKQFFESPFGDKPVAWTGTFEVPVRVDSIRAREK